MDSVFVLELIDVSGIVICLVLFPVVAFFHWKSFCRTNSLMKEFWIMNCEGCGEKEDFPYRILHGVQINRGKKERVYLLCDTCEEKLCRIIEGHALWKRIPVSLVAHCVRISNAVLVLSRVSIEHVLFVIVRVIGGVLFDSMGNFNCWFCIRYTCDDDN